MNFSEMYYYWNLLTWWDDDYMNNTNNLFTYITSNTIFTNPDVTKNSNYIFYQIYQHKT